MIEDIELLHTVIHGTTAFEFLRTGLELDLFGHLEKPGGLDLAGVAGALGTEEHAARVLLLGLASLRLVHKEGDTYRNAPLARRCLLRGSPNYLGPRVEMQRHVTNPGIGDLLESVRQDTNVGLRHLAGSGPTLYDRLAAHPEVQRVYYENMGDASSKTFPLVAETYDFSSVRHVIDVGGGEATNALTLARAHPHLKVTVFDLDEALGLAARNIKDAGLEDRVHTHAGDLFADPLPEGADAVLFSHLFESWSLERNTELLRKCHRALPPGGAVLVYSFVSDDDNTGPLSAAFMSAYFLAIATGEGMVYSGQDVCRCLADAGFSRTERHDGVGFQHALIAGIK
ncbi:acetylserotonin O-methyltransferase [Streptomyces sp. NBC_01795]|uniref:methyltransferase n=1 Tax=unclassified Streptomyces TaxID=2593676 RepID=UPI002DD964B3|nr:MULTISPECIES: methyltransferase [unclassified Streptomyces]WSA95917.1 acetylserotonin O-methyltransferase [Streptomyces sp. NBC_01795]WSS11457.1 acetylserotonin O-methyltransferase [Streptomyces sp. NBC_01186]